MSKRLEKARKETKKLPDSFFGKGTGLKFEDLPCVKTKDDKIKKTYNLRESSVQEIEKVAKKHKVSVGDLISDIIDKAIAG
jgi:hypothetical protein